ncbi:PREDICTED: maestro heat-like repeat-containing protein family member 1 [Galeopterus variegatus]|uniref:Maestro heat-like repeat-containing protein family member 1 n=1 Tax=Galeopterus variegatus TaxID=482537 RepID=A0ABM0R6E1_GALVR|nr:PREDICTED: maestro heat-like repeat-containing protein family member 1 [Galeopterus variegatus]
MKKMFTAMLGCSETAERDTEWDISGRNIENFMEALQAASKLSADNILEVLKLLEVKIISNKMSMLLCQKVTDIIISYLRAMKPEGELEEICTAVLMALGTHCPRMVILKLWDKAHQHNLPPRSLLVAVGKLALCQVPQTEKLRSEVMNSVIVAIQEDRKPVQMALLNFINTLGQYDYLTLPQGNTVINYLIKLSESDPSNEEDIQLMCSKILQMVHTTRVSLPKLVTLACQPSNISAFVILSKTTTELALRARSLGQVPYLSSFHLRPAQFISPQRLLTHLMLCSLKPYREKKFGVSALRLLHALHPITSLHPVINSNVGQLWMKEIPQMLQILDEHSEKSLSQKEWESRLLQFSSQSLAAINDDSWLEQLATVILEKIRYFSNNEEKAFLYKFFGFNLRTSRSPKLVKTMLSSILDTGHEELQEREGIAEALSIVSLRHLEIVLDQLQEYGTVLTNQHASSILKLMKEHQQTEWRLVCKTIYLSYSKIISRNKRAALLHVDAILAVVLQHYHHCIVEKELIREEPMNGISSSVRQKAMDIVTDVRKLRPLLEPNDRSELLQTCCKSVLCLPPSDVLQKEAASPKEGQANMELFRETMHSLRRLMEAFITEKPDWIQYCLQLLDIWLNSQKDNERERAMWCAARVLGFTAKMNNFNVEIQFTHLGRLVRMLAMRCQDTVDNVCFLSAHAVYNLYCILLLQKQMTRKKQGLWEEEGKSKVYSANMFYNNTLEIAKAFAEYFTQLQLTNLVLTAIEGLTHSKAKVSLAAAQLMSAVMRERGRDMIKIEEVVEGILERLNLQLEPSTKEETLQAMCSLAGSNTHTVVPLLLSKPLPWDRTNLALWKTFGTHRETTINVLQLLIVILEKNQSREETGEMAFRPVAVRAREERRPGI